MPTGSSIMRAVSIRFRLCEADPTESVPRLKRDSPLSSIALSSKVKLLFARATPFESPLENHPSPQTVNLKPK